jgi:hypothetical protein
MGSLQALTLRINTYPMHVGRHHVVHGFVVIVVLIQLGFAIAFLVDAAETNTTYDALANHRVAVQGRTVGCAVIVTGRSQNYTARLCRIDYRYSGHSFTAVIPYGQTATFFIDPLNTSYRMNEVNFEKGPEATVGDLVFASVSFFGALAVTVVHLEHLHQRRSSHRVGHPR